MLYIHKIECYLVAKSNEVLTHAKSWMNLETLCKVEESSHKGLHFVSFHLHRISKIRLLLKLFIVTFYLFFTKLLRCMLWPYCYYDRRSCLRMTSVQERAQPKERERFLKTFKHMNPSRHQVIPIK